MKRRAVDLADEPQHGRRQPQTSCDSCRRRKLKCDRGEPCSSCVTRGLPCHGQPNVKGPAMDQRSGCLQGSLHPCLCAADSLQARFRRRLTVFYGDFTPSSKSFLQTAGMSGSSERRALRATRPTHPGRQQKPRTSRMTNGPQRP